MRRRPRLQRGTPGSSLGRVIAPMTTGGQERWAARAGCAVRGTWGSGRFRVRGLRVPTAQQGSGEGAEALPGSVAATDSGVEAAPALPIGSAGAITSCGCQSTGDIPVGVSRSSPPGRASQPRPGPAARVPPPRRPWSSGRSPGSPTGGRRGRRGTCAISASFPGALGESMSDAPGPTPRAKPAAPRSARTSIADRRGDQPRQPEVGLAPAGSGPGWRRPGRRWRAVRPAR